MPIKHTIWEVAKSPAPLKEIALASAQQLEDMIVARPGIPCRFILLECHVV